MQLTYADLKVNSRAIRAVTGHRSDLCLEADYADMQKVVSANQSAQATIELHSYRQGLLERPPDNIQGCSRNSVVLPEV